MIMSKDARTSLYDMTISSSVLLPKTGEWTEKKEFGVLRVNANASSGRLVSRDRGKMWAGMTQQGGKAFLN